MQGFSRQLAAEPISRHCLASWKQNIHGVCHEGKGGNLHWGFAFCGWVCNRPLYLTYYKVHLILEGKCYPPLTFWVSSCWLHDSGEMANKAGRKHGFFNYYYYSLTKLICKELGKEYLMTAELYECIVMKCFYWMYCVVLPSPSHWQMRLTGQWPMHL